MHRAPEPRLTLARRKWVYAIVTSAASLLVFYGYATETEAAVWIGALSAILGNGMATDYSFRPRP